MSRWNEPIHNRQISGRALRFIVLAEIRRNHTMTVAQMATFLADLGYTLPGRPSKVISDALRWEVARGRVNRTARGVYTYGTVPPSTARRVRIFAQRCNAWIVAVMRGEQPPPTPPTRLDRHVSPIPWPAHPTDSPWRHLGWLWTT